MSSPLVWLLVRNNNSFLVKRDGAQFTRERNNLTGCNSFKFSGLANTKTVGVEVADKKVAVVLKKTRRGAAFKPSSAYSRTVLTKHVNGGKVKGAEAIKTFTSKSFYRGDLTRFAIARYHALHRSLKVDSSKINKKEKRARGAKAAKAAKAAKKPAATTA